MDGTRGVELARRLDPRLVLPVHYGDYTVMRSPLSAFLAGTDAVGIIDRIVHCGHGEHVRVPCDPGAAPEVY